MWQAGYNHIMNDTEYSSDEPHNRQPFLRLLLTLRLIGLLALSLTLTGLHYYSDLNLPLGPLAGVIGAMVLLSIFSLYSLHRQQRVSQHALFLQLAADLVATALMLYAAGGAGNPFASYMLLPVCLSAASLRPPLAITLTALALTLYTTLLFYYQPLLALAPHNQHQHGGSGLVAQLHIWGMWLSFVLSALLISYFLLHLARTVRRQQEQIQQHQNQILRDEQLMAVATLAAGTAHELGTPLATMTLLTETLQYNNDPKQHEADLAQLQLQLQRCKTTLQQLRQTAAQQAQVLPVHEACSAILAHWQVLRPELQADIQLPDDNDTQATLSLSLSLEQALLNILNNAADASPLQLDIHIQWDSQYLYWQVNDRGPGISPQQEALLGKQHHSSKSDGLGLGLLLSHASLERLGGSIQRSPRRGGGTRCDITIPLQQALI
ncbi:MAG: two-component system sensor histidine kinase RegB [Pseudohongiellaceae bacterium]|jgi:two-component system sensor histidine kinase RegB